MTRLLPPMLLLAAAVSASYLPRQESTGCTAASQALKSLLVSDVKIYGGNPLRAQNSSIAFHISNPATGFATTCAANSAALTGNGMSSDPYIWYDCEPVAASPKATMKFQFESVLMMLTVNQTWVCDDGAATTRFEAYGLEVLSYTCQEITNEQFRRECLHAEQQSVPVEIATEAT